MLRRIAAITLCLLILFNFTTINAQALFGGDDGFESLVWVKPYSSVNRISPGQTIRAALQIDIKEHWHVNSATPFQDWLIPAEIIIAESDDYTISNIDYPDGSMVELLGEKMSLYDGTVFIFFDVNLSNDFSNSKLTLPVTFSYQACNNRECKAPADITENLPIEVGTNSSSINQEIFENDSSNQLKADVESVASSSEPSEIEKLINKYGFWGYILALGLAFITGLLLSFSPCTYPMIPITISIFAGQERSIGRGFVLSLFYVGTMAVMYGIMGLLVSLVGGVFGAWLANPYVVTSIAAIFVVFSLSMFGLFELQVPMALRSKISAKKGGGGVGGAIVLGVVAALVVSPCVGPFVAGILLYIATVGNPLFGFATLFIFAIGLGTLYILLGTFSSAISKIPKAGEWMEQVKKFFGFVLLLMALYFLRTIISETLLYTLTALLLLTFSVFGGGFDRLTNESSGFARLKKLLGIIAFVIGLYLLLGVFLISGFIMPPASNWLPMTGGKTTVETKLIDWHTDLEAGLEQAIKEGKPVIIDTWATWCVNCKVLDKKTFGNIDVANEIKRFYPLKIQLEKQDSFETKNFIEKFNLKTYSLPTVLLLDSRGTVKKILQGVVDPDDMINELKKVN